MKNSYEISINFYGTPATSDFGAKKSTAIRSPLDILSLRIEETEIQYFNLELPIMSVSVFFRCFPCLRSVLCASVCLPFVLIIRWNRSNAPHIIVPVSDEFCEQSGERNFASATPIIINMRNLTPMNGNDDEQKKKLSYPILQSMSQASFVY